MFWEIFVNNIHFNIVLFFDLVPIQSYCWLPIPTKYVIVGHTVAGESESCNADAFGGSFSAEASAYASATKARACEAVVYNADRQHLVILLTH